MGSEMTAYNKYNPSLSKDGKIFKNVKNPEFDGKTPTLHKIMSYISKWSS